METRLAEAAEANPAPEPFVMPVSAGDEESEAVSAKSGATTSATDEEKYGAASSVEGADDGAPWPVDDSSEAAFRADARERGEPVVVPPAKSEVEDESDGKAGLPTVEELMMRIPANVRETMDNLFRAKFVKVRKVPKRVLKGHT